MTNEFEMILVDTNVLVYALNDDAPQHVASRQIMERAERGEVKLCVTSQTLTEFFSIVTSPRRVKIIRTPIEAVQAIESILARPGMTHLTLTPEMTNRWLEFVRRTPVRGADVFDLQLAATALANGVTKIYTFNTTDFERIDGIEVIVP